MKCRVRVKVVCLSLRWSASCGLTRSCDSVMTVTNALVTSCCESLSHSLDGWTTQHVSVCVSGENDLWCCTNLHFNLNKMISYRHLNQPLVPLTVLVTSVIPSGKVIRKHSVKFPKWFLWREMNGAAFHVVACSNVTLIWVHQFLYRVNPVILYLAAVGVRRRLSSPTTIYASIYYYLQYIEYNL